MILTACMRQTPQSILQVWIDLIALSLRVYFMNIPLFSLLIMLAIRPPLVIAMELLQLKPCLISKLLRMHFIDFISVGIV